MGSPLGPTLANIIMTEFEDIIIKPLINSGTIKFYKRYVDDTLILTKPSDIPYIFAKFNSFHPSIQFTIDDFNDNDIHFLDIQTHSSGTSVYRKPTHTGQYQHISSFSPWSRKVAWLRALVNRAYKICSTETLLKDELQHIQNFISWNGFPRKLSLKLIEQFKPPVQTPIDHETQVDNSHMGTNNNDPKIWIPLPYIGKYGTRLTRLFIHRITPLLKLKCNFIINWKTTNSNSFVSCKDKTPTKYHSSVVYEFTCPGCKNRYIGKTDRCFYTRIKEHARDSKSEIFEHITSCEHFQHIKSILELYPDDQTNLSQTCVLPEFIFNNSKIIDRSDHWSLLLFKEALAIRRFKPELNHGTKASKDLIIFN